MPTIINCRSLVEGRATGEVLISEDPISFYGGVDVKTGVVTEKGHCLYGKSIAGKILVYPYGKGSTVGSYAIYGLKRYGVAPKAIVNIESEPIIIIGCIMAKIPLMDKPDKNPFKILSDGDRVEVIAGKKKGVIKLIT